MFNTYIVMIYFISEAVTMVMNEKFIESKIMKAHNSSVKGDIDKPQIPFSKVLVYVKCTV